MLLVPQDLELFSHIVFSVMKAWPGGSAVPTRPRSDPKKAAAHNANFRRESRPARGRLIAQEVDPI
jgi:hypothetical protein